MNEALKLYPKITQLRVRYSETDQMSYVYYGHYAQYFEIGRTEWVRALGLTYKSMEQDHSLMLPVYDLHIQYHKPAVYDDLLEIHTWLTAEPGVKLQFAHQIFNEKKECLVSGEVILVFIDASSRKPVRAPSFFLEALKSSDQ